MSVVTLAVAKAYLGISHTAQDSTIQILLDAAENWLETTFGIALASAEREELLDGGGKYLWPTYRPITEIDTVEDTWDSDAEYDCLLVGDGRIQRADSNGLALANYAWAAGDKRWRATYTAGHALMPAALKLAVLKFVAKSYQARAGESSNNAAGVAAAFPSLMDSEIHEMIKPFSRHRSVIA
jgi:uncharacterized phiE125 gp8 family phage protein